MKKFHEMSLIEPLLKNLRIEGYETPTPIQAQAIPYLLERHDLLGIAQTGTGKTAAYSLPIIQHLFENQNKSITSAPRALILAPTRELASQINESIVSYSKNLEINSTAIFGGVGQGQQIKALRSGIDILVATPGRLLDLIQQGHLKLDRVEIFVLDEADRMLDMGFIDDIKMIIHRLPGKKQTLLFSATMPIEIKKLADKILKNPKKVEVTPASSTVENVKQRVVFCRKVDKYQLLRKILTDETTGLVMVFTKTRHAADKVATYLTHHHIRAAAIHGEKNQNDRELALRDFKAGRIKVLIATDIAARGIDIEGVSHVINYELPLEPESYVHRIGRTARAGKEGEAISFCDDSERIFLDKIQRLIQLYLPTEAYTGTPEAAVKILERPQKKVTPPTPGRSQEKGSPQKDYSKRQKPAAEAGRTAKNHPGFRSKKKRK